MKIIYEEVIDQQEKEIKYVGHEGIKLQYDLPKRYLQREGAVYATPSSIIKIVRISGTIHDDLLIPNASYSQKDFQSKVGRIQNAIKSLRAVEEELAAEPQEWGGRKEITLE